MPFHRRARRMAPGRGPGHRLTVFSSGSGRRFSCRCRGAWSSIRRGPLKDRPSGNSPRASIGKLPSWVRQAPTRIEVLQGETQSVHFAGGTRHSSDRCDAAPCAAAPFRRPSLWRRPAAAARSAADRAGGVPRMFSRIHLPRFTGEVRVGFDVTVSIAACVITPPRTRASAGCRWTAKIDTRRK